MWHTSQITWFENVASKIIVDDVLLHGRTAGQILDYFKTVLDVLKHHCATLNMKFFKWFQDRWKFVGMDVAAGATQPAQSKNEAFVDLERPNTWGDLHMLIGVFGFYRQFLTLYDLDIIPWRYIFSNKSQPGTLSKKEEMELMQNLWNPENQRLLERLKKDILPETTLARLYSSRRFYIKTYWSKYLMGVVLLQSDVSEEAIKSEAQ